MIFCPIQLPPVNCPSMLSFPSLPQKMHLWPWIVSIHSTYQMETWPVNGENYLNQWTVKDSLIDVLTIFFLPFQIYLSPSWSRPLGLISMAWLMEPLAFWLLVEFDQWRAPEGDLGIRVGLIIYYQTCFLLSRTGPQSKASLSQEIPSTQLSCPDSGSHSSR